MPVALIVDDNDGNRKLVRDLLSGAGFRTLEAATGAIRTGPVQMLVEHGATIDARNYSVLWCGAVARRNNDMLRFLESRRLSQSAIDCATVRALW